MPEETMTVGGSDIHWGDLTVREEVILVAAEVEAG